MNNPNPGEYESVNMHVSSPNEDKSAQVNGAEEEQDPTSTILNQNHHTLNQPIKSILIVHLLRKPNSSQISRTQEELGSNSSGGTWSTYFHSHSCSQIIDTLFFLSGLLFLSVPIPLRVHCDFKY